MEISNLFFFFFMSLWNNKDPVYLWDFRHSAGLNVWDRFGRVGCLGGLSDYLWLWAGKYTPPGWGLLFNSRGHSKVKLQKGPQKEGIERERGKTVRQ